MKFTVNMNMTFDVDDNYINKFLQDENMSIEENNNFLEEDITNILKDEFESEEITNIIINISAKNETH